MDMTFPEIRVNKMNTKKWTTLLGYLGLFEALINYNWCISTLKEQTWKANWTRYSSHYLIHNAGVKHNTDCSHSIIKMVHSLWNYWNKDLIRIYRGISQGWSDGVHVGPGRVCGSEKIHNVAGKEVWEWECTCTESRYGNGSTYVSGKQIWEWEGMCPASKCGSIYVFRK